MDTSTGGPSQQPGPTPAALVLARSGGMPRVGALRLAASSAPTRPVPQLAIAARQEEGPVHARGDVQTGLPGESEWRGSRLFVLLCGGGVPSSHPHPSLGLAWVACFVSFFLAPQKAQPKHASPKQPAPACLRKAKLRAGALRKENRAFVSAQRSPAVETLAAGPVHARARRADRVAR